MINMLLQGFIDIFTVNTLLWMLFGTTTGIIIGAIPGLTSTMGVALLVPLTFGMGPIPSICMLLGIYCGGTYGGSVTAILINTPGTPAAAATALDGYELAKKGKAGKALKMAIYSSTVGGLISAAMLIFISPLLAKIAIKFGAPEYFALVMLGLTVVAGISGKSILKGLMAGALGLLFSTVGMDPMIGTARLAFDNINLIGGLSTIPVLIGLFALSEILTQSENIGKAGSKVELCKVEGDQSLSFKEFMKHMKTTIKGSFIGTYVGAIPGIGGGVASFVSYNEAIRASKHPETFGKGELDGVAASEAANNGATGATLIPLLTLGIPGDVVTAVLLGAFMIQGLTPGPLLFKEHGATVYAIFAGLIVINIIMLIIGVFGIKYFAYINNIPAELMFSSIYIMCAIGAYAVDSNMFQIGTMLFFGVLGYFMRKLEMPGGPFLIAFLLGPMWESNFRRTMLVFEGKMYLIFTRPIAVFFIVLCILSIYWIVKNEMIKKVREVDEEIVKDTVKESA